MVVNLACSIQGSVLIERQSSVRPFHLVTSGKIAEDFIIPGGMGYRPARVQPIGRSRIVKTASLRRPVQPALLVKNRSSKRGHSLQPSKTDNDGFSPHSTLTWRRGQLEYGSLLAVTSACGRAIETTVVVNGEACPRPCGVVSRGSESI